MPVTARKPSVSVSLVAVPEASAAVTYGLQEVFSSVGKTWELLTGEPVKVRLMTPRIAGRSTRTIRSSLGVPIKADTTFRDAHRPDIVIVADLAIEEGVNRDSQWREETRWLVKQYKNGATICSVCTGSIMLAAAGLLDGLEATTHWSAKRLFEANYPDVILRPERVLVPAGPEHRIVTSGGSASWADLALYLIARFCGQEEARRIAKIFVLGDRSDGQLPFAAMVRPKQHDDAIVAGCQSWIAEHYALSNPVQRLVAHSGLAQRTFKRRFSNATGYTPLAYVQTLRVEEAKQMLEASDEAIDAIALAVGYDDPNSFRRIFKRSAGISPHRYRRRFRAVGPASAGDDNR